MWHMTTIVGSQAPGTVHYFLVAVDVGDIVGVLAE